MNTKPHDTSFGALFGASWNTFKGHYGLCLGIGVLVLIIIIAVSIAVFLIALSFSSKDSIYSGAIAAIVSSFFIMSVIGMPLIVIVGFTIVKRVGKQVGMRSGWFSRLFLVSIAYNLVLLPGMIFQQLGNPGQFEEVKLTPELIAASMQEVTEKQDNPNVVGPAGARVQEINAEIEALHENQSFALVLFGNFLSLIASIFVFCWAPWASYAACDPKETSEGGETIKRGFALARGAYGSIIGCGIVIGIIAVFTLAMCFLPGIFFGWPLAMAFGPSVYLILRENASAPPLPDTA